jgi:hypothetical protein
VEPHLYSSIAELATLLSPCFLASLIFLLLRWKLHVPPKRRLIFNPIHSVVTQEIELFITTAVKTLSYMNLFDQRLKNRVRLGSYFSTGGLPPISSSWRHAP